MKFHPEFLSKTAGQYSPQVFALDTSKCTKYFNYIICLGPGCIDTQTFVFALCLVGSAALFTSSIGWPSATLYYFYPTYSKKVLSKQCTPDHTPRNAAYDLCLQPASVAQLDAPSYWRPGGRGFNPPPRSATFFRGD